MKISSKIIWNTSLFLAVLALNGVVSFLLLQGVSGELRTVVRKDVVLMDTVSSIARHQLQKAIVFERLRRIADELAYQPVTPARKEHLVFYTQLTRRDFDTLSKNGAVNIVDARQLVDAERFLARDANARRGLDAAVAILKDIESTHIHYDAAALEVFETVKAGQYEVAPEKIDDIHKDERKLAAQFDKLLAELKVFTRQALENAAGYERTARDVLLGVFLLSLAFGLILAWSIISSINRPLAGLLKATHLIGGGDLSVKIDESKRNELGELSHEFNRMSARLAEAMAVLEAQRRELQANYDLTAQQKKDLEKVNEELDRFVHTVSHDIRSPLMGIAWYADFLKTHYYSILEKKGQDSIDGVCRGVDRANALINDLLTLTRIWRVRNPYQIVSAQLVMEDVIATLDYKIKQADVLLHVQPDLPVMVCDPIKIKEVFLNLMTNAIKFSSGRPGIRPIVHVEGREMIDGFEFVVRDNGIGIAPEHHKEVFDIFKRLDTAQKYEGTGAGLSIVKSVVEDHGGKIWIVSAPGSGSEFHFTIPRSLEISASAEGPAGA